MQDLVCCSINLHTAQVGILHKYKLIASKCNIVFEQYRKYLSVLYYPHYTVSKESNYVVGGWKHYNMLVFSFTLVHLLITGGKEIIYYLVYLFNERINTPSLIYITIQTHCILKLLICSCTAWLLFWYLYLRWNVYINMGIIIYLHYVRIWC